MSEANRPRRALAEIKWAADPSAIVWIGSRSIHQYWPLLSGYFRDILLPPHRRAGENAVSWTWSEPAENKALSASELAGVRKRLTADHLLFAENLTRGLDGDDAGGLRGQGNADELSAAIDGAMARLVGSGDDELATFVCRTENGLRVHSWGAPTAAVPTYPDVREREISGQVIAGGKPAARHEVNLESAAGDPVATTQTESNGSFRFPKIARGAYRLRARSQKTGAQFPEDGLAVELVDESIGGLVLREESEEVATAKNRASAWPRWLMSGAFVAALIFSGGWWLWHRDASGSEPARTSERTSELNSSYATAPAETRGRPAAGKSTAETRGREPVKPSEREPARAGEASSISTSAIPTSVLKEEEIALPASALLPGHRAGSPAPAGAPITSATGPGSNGAPVSSSIGAKADANGSAVASSAAGIGPRPAAPPAAAPAAMDKTSAGKPTSSDLLDVAPSASKTQLSKTTPIERKPGEKARVVAATSGEKQPDVAAQKTDDTAADPAAEIAREASAPSAAFATSTLGETATAVTTTAAAVVDESEVVESGAQEGVGPVAKEEIQISEARGAAEAANTSLLATRRWWQVRQMPWQVRLLRDAILPTVPVRSDAPEQLTVLRERLLADYEARLPAAFRMGKMRSGLAFAGDDGVELAWSKSGKGLSVRAGRAEFAFDAVSAGGTAYVTRGDGAIVAEVRSQKADMILRVADGMSVWQWFRLEVADGDVESAERFAWRSASDGPLPAAWLSDARAEGATVRLWVPLTAAHGSGVSHSLALVDHETGWALVGEARVAPTAEFVR